MSDEIIAKFENDIALCLFVLANCAYLHKTLVESNEIKSVTFLNSGDFDIKHLFPVLHLESPDFETLFDHFLSIDSFSHGQNGIDFIDFVNEVLAIDQNFVHLVMNLMLLDLVTKSCDGFDRVDIIFMQEMLCLMQDGW